VDVESGANLEGMSENMHNDVGCSVEFLGDHVCVVMTKMGVKL